MKIKWKEASMYFFNFLECIVTIHFIDLWDYWFLRYWREWNIRWAVSQMLKMKLLQFRCLISYSCWGHLWASHGDLLAGYSCCKTELFLYFLLNIILFSTSSENLFFKLHQFSLTYRICLHSNNSASLSNIDKRETKFVTIMALSCSSSGASLNIWLLCKLDGQK